MVIYILKFRALLFLKLLKKNTSLYKNTNAIFFYHKKLFDS